MGNPPAPTDPFAAWPSGLPERSPHAHRGAGACDPPRLLGRRAFAEVTLEIVRRGGPPGLKPNPGPYMGTRGGCVRTRRRPRPPARERPTAGRAAPGWGRSWLGPAGSELLLLCASGFAVARCGRPGTLTQGLSLGANAAAQNEPSCCTRQWVLLLVSLSREAGAAGHWQQVTDCPTCGRPPERALTPR